MAKQCGGSLVPFFFIVAPVAASGCTYAEKRNGECEEDDSVLMDMDLATTIMFVAGCVLLACISYVISAWFRYRFRAQRKQQMQPGEPLMQPMHQQMPASEQMRMLIDSLKEEAKVTGVPELSVAKMNEASREFLNTVADFERLIKEAKAPKHTEKTGPAKPAEMMDDISNETTADSLEGGGTAADATGLDAVDVDMPKADANRLREVSSSAPRPTQPEGGVDKPDGTEGDQGAGALC